MGPSGPTPTPKGTHRAGCPGPCLSGHGLWRSPRRRSTARAHGLLELGTTERNLALSSLSSFQVFIYIDEISPQSFLLCIKMLQLFQPFLISRVLKSLHHLDGPTLDSFLYIHVLSTESCLLLKCLSVVIFMHIHASKAFTHVANHLSLCHGQQPPCLNV